jgi:glycosyltransferase involved in cell wall biosynthesis
MPPGDFLSWQSIKQGCKGKVFWRDALFYLYRVLYSAKNIPGLIKAYGGFRDSSGSNIKLLIAGEMKWRSDDLDSALKSSPYKDDIIFTGRVSDENLRKLTASAFAMVYVSFFEGFGLPCLSMKCECR